MGRSALDETEWMFEMLYQLGESADQHGMRRLSGLLELCMDVYIAEERLVLDASMVFRSRRAAAKRKRDRVWPFNNRPEPRQYIRPTPPDWFNALEARIEATRNGSVPSLQKKNG